MTRPEAVARARIRSPYRPPEFVPSDDAGAPIQLPADLPPADLADELRVQLARIAAGRDLRVLRRQAREGFRAVMRHARARRLRGHRRAPLDVRRGPAATAAERRNGGPGTWRGGRGAVKTAALAGGACRAGPDRAARPAPFGGPTAPRNARRETP